MRLAHNQALKVFLTSFGILLIAITSIHLYNYKSITKNYLDYSEDTVGEISVSIENHFLEKVKTVKTMSISPIILQALDRSNKYYSVLTEQQRDNEIQAKNDEWKIIEDQDHQFILRYTNNTVSKYLKNQQNLIEGEYGEIFITDKFGALIASTTKLTTFAHGNKYWWRGAYNNGEGAVFFDDRGYDESVGGYVLGVVVPIYYGDEIIGILKANLNILGSINEIILNVEGSEQLSLVRSGGLIVYKEGLEPLSNRISEKILGKMLTPTTSFILKDKGLEGIYAISEIGITTNKRGYKFGGNHESHAFIKVNISESWYVIDYHPISHVIDPINNNLRILISLGLFLSFVLAILSMIIGNRAAKPIKELIKQTLKISEGDFESKVLIKRTDEIGQLSMSFNNMARNLKETTTSLDNLNAETSERKKKEDALLTAAGRWKTTFNASNDVIWILNEEHIVVQSNEAAKEVFGLSLDSIIGKNCYSIVHKDNKPFTNCPIERSKKSLVRESMELQVGNSWFEVTVDPVLGEENSYNGAIHIIRDITERKKNETDIENKSQELQTLLNNSEKQRIANLVILNDLNITTKTLKSEVVERKKAEKQVQKELQEKITLLQELYHRTKNNMQVISSMLRMEARRHNDDIVAKSFQGITTKINTMALVHQMLYQANDLSRINLNEYIQNLVKLIVRGFTSEAANVTFHYELEDIFVQIDTVMPLGLVLNELITNALKHAFPASSNGKITIIMKSDLDNVINITIKDDGVGIPDDMDLRLSDSMGLKTVFSLIEHQMTGKVNYLNKDGLIWNVSFCNTFKKERI